MKASMLFLFVGCVFVAANAQEMSKKEKKMELRLQDDIEYLAADALEGRASGSPGEELSAEYIANRFKKLRLKTTGEDKSYYQKFNITTLRIATGKSEMNIHGIPRTPMKDFYPLSYSVNQGQFEGYALLAGFGIHSPELEHDDYENLDVEGKAVFIDYSSPDGIHPHSRFVAWHGVQRRVDQAAELGATAVIFYTNNPSVKVPDGQLSLQTEGPIPVFFVKGTPEVPPGLEVPISLKVDILSEQETAHNIIAFKNNRKAHTIVIGAHHDHLGRGEVGGSREMKVGNIHNGADDNASGVASLLELARELRKCKRAYKKYNYVFVAFSGEEMGLLGSKYFVENSPVPLNEISAMINMDMVGKLDSNKKVLVINGVGTADVWEKAINAIELDTNRIRSIKTTEGGIGASDHTAFYLKNIPAVHFFTGQHEHYHKSTDDPEIINYSGQVWVTQYISDVIEQLNQHPKATFTQTADENKSSGRMNFKVTLGIMPDYLYDGEGLKIDGVKNGGVAEKAGLEKGDVIISLAGQKIMNIRDYMAILKELDEGQEVEVQVKRKGSIFSKMLKF
jgi:aminopeptidase YwaD